MLLSFLVKHEEVTSKQLIDWGGDLEGKGWEPALSGTGYQVSGLGESQQQGGIGLLPLPALLQSQPALPGFDSNLDTVENLEPCQLSF